MLSNEAVQRVYKSAHQQQLLQLQLKDLGGPALLDRLNRKATSSKTQAEKAVWAWLRKRKRKCCAFRSPRRNDGSWNRDSDIGTSDVDSSDSSEDDQSVPEAEELRETAQSHQVCMIFLNFFPRFFIATDNHQIYELWRNLKSYDFTVKDLQMKTEKKNDQYSFSK